MTKFIPVTPRQWKGRYRKPAGKESSFHLSTSGKIKLIWYDNDIKNECYVKETSAVKQMAKKINQVKRKYSGYAGGSFVINEFGQVITPVMGRRERYFLGELIGPLYFEHPEENDKYITLEGNGYKCGDIWDRPYMGIKYNLHRDDYIYFYREEEEESFVEEAPKQDKKLIKDLRKIRPYGGMSFLVNPYGVVITKKEFAEAGWLPVYVGMINYKKWFEKEV